MPGVNQILHSVQNDKLYFQILLFRRRRSEGDQAQRWPGELIADIFFDINPIPFGVLFRYFVCFSVLWLN
jgi:hypothetical protein